MTGTLESVLYLEDLELTIAKGYPHHVKAHCLEESGWPMKEVLPSQGTDGGLFAGGEGFEWMSETGPSTQLDFGEDDDVSVPKNQVQLALTGPVVALDEDVALRRTR